MTQDELYMQRCIDLAKLSGKAVRSNPNVGAILVYNETIIGEGYHRAYGSHHAEIEAIHNVKENDRKHIPDSTLYVSLEPCCIERKTPACTEAIIKNKIKKVVISATDPNPDVSGKSIKLLRGKGVTVITDVLTKKGNDLIRPFRAALNKRPYVIIKFAQSSDAYFGKKGQQVWISNEYSKKLSHKWRTEADGILIGYQTALTDDPQLTVRSWEGDNPARIVMDRDVSLPKNLKLFQDGNHTIVITQKIAKSENVNIDFLTPDKYDLASILTEIYKQGIHRLIIEGGKATINRYIEENLWDEARIITSSNALGSGIRSPFIVGDRYDTEQVINDRIDYVYNRNCL